VAGDDRVQQPDRVQVIAAVGEVRAVAAADPAAIDEERLLAVGERRPLDRLSIEIELGSALGDPVEQSSAVLVASCIVVALSTRSSACSSFTSSRSSRSARSSTTSAATMSCEYDTQSEKLAS
jgi:hypothetical protein